LRGASSSDCGNDSEQEVKYKERSSSWPAVKNEWQAYKKAKRTDAREEMLKRIYNLPIAVLI
jgi:hypothetical protein